MAAAILGLAAILHTSAVAFQTFKYLGVGYLLYMAWNALREHGALRVEQNVDARSALQVTVTAILINILNPKLSIFFLAFLPQFIDASELHPVSRMLLLSAVFMLMTFVVFVGYGLFAASIWTPHYFAPARPDLDAADVRGRFRCPGCQARLRRALTCQMNARFPADTGRLGVGDLGEQQPQDGGKPRGSYA